ncbi:hypothetical protein AB0300_18235 [Microbacterium sp. NPDC078814]|uniref:hypothetical protein n=1 Tax=Microbacterium sp. NPDC078814 TaxID=3154767 RepID=UPI0034509973
MAKPRVKWNRAAFRELRLTPEALELVEEHADAVAARAGSGYEASAVYGKNRARASVITGNFEAILDNARHNTLLRALGGTESAPVGPKKYSYTTRAGKTIQATQAQIDNWTRNRRS